MIKVLAVDDSALMRKLLGKIFEAETDFSVEFARDGIEALAKLATFQPDVITLDVQMPHMDGLACLDRIMMERPCPVVMVSSLTAAGAEATLEAFRLGAVDFAAKPQGAISLKIEDFAPQIVGKVRTAAGARIRSSLRLKDRIRHKMGTVPARHPKASAGDKQLAPASGQGVVLVGTSTGGPPALETLLTALPADFPWPIVIAQHMPASFTGALARRLDTICALAVREVVDPVLLEPSFAYIARGDADLVLSRRGGSLFAASVSARRDYPWHPSADRMVRSALDHVPESQLIGILMTGMGNDGAAAMAELRMRGGRTIAEAEDTAVVWGMPGELVKAGGADFVVPLPEIADRLQRLTPCL